MKILQFKSISLKSGATQRKVYNFKLEQAVIKNVVCCCTTLAKFALEVWIKVSV